MSDAVLTLIGILAGVASAGFVALTVVGVVLLSRRARRGGAGALSGRTQAGAELLRADDALRDARDDLEFARAQFGDDATRDFAARVASAERELRRAFELHQRLDEPDAATEARRREWTREVAAIASRSRRTLDEERQRFIARRDEEAGAAALADELERRLGELRDELPVARKRVASLRAAYAPALVEAIAENPDRADDELESVAQQLESTRATVASSRVTAVVDALRDARGTLGRAASLLAAIEQRRTELAAADAGLETLRGEIEEDLRAARTVRDAPPDPDSGDAVGRAIAALESALAAARETTGARRDPVAALDALVDASAALDVSVAAARNQQQRLEGARGALAGALLSARTQIAAARELIGSRRSGVSARTRLAEPERQLLLAENEADPVEALDAARRAQTHARDADALARYRG